MANALPPKYEVIQRVHNTYGGCVFLVEDFLLGRRSFDQWLQSTPGAPPRDSEGCRKLEAYLLMLRLEIAVLEYTQKQEHRMPYEDLKTLVIDTVGTIASISPGHPDFVPSRFTMSTQYEFQRSFETGEEINWSTIHREDPRLASSELWEAMPGVADWFNRDGAVTPVPIAFRPPQIPVPPMTALVPNIGHPPIGSVMASSAPSAAHETRAPPLYQPVPLVPPYRPMDVEERLQPEMPPESHAETGHLVKSMGRLGSKSKVEGKAKAQVKYVEVSDEESGTVDVKQVQKPIVLIVPRRKEKAKVPKSSKYVEDSDMEIEADVPVKVEVDSTPPAQERQKKRPAPPPPVLHNGTIPPPGPLRDQLLTCDNCRRRNKDRKMCVISRGHASCESCRKWKISCSRCPPGWKKLLGETMTEEQELQWKILNRLPYDIGKSRIPSSTPHPPPGPRPSRPSRTPAPAPKSVPIPGSFGPRSVQLRSNQIIPNMITLKLPPPKVSPIPQPAVHQSKRKASSRKNAYQEITDDKHEDNAQADAATEESDEDTSEAFYETRPKKRVRIASPLESGPSTSRTNTTRWAPVCRVPGQGRQLVSAPSPPISKFDLLASRQDKLEGRLAGVETNLATSNSTQELMLASLQQLNQVLHQIKPSPLGSPDLSAPRLEERLDSMSSQLHRLALTTSRLGTDVSTYGARLTHVLASTNGLCAGIEAQRRDLGNIRLRQIQQELAPAPPQDRQVTTRHDEQVETTPVPRREVEVETDRILRCDVGMETERVLGNEDRNAATGMTPRSFQDTSVGHATPSTSATTQFPSRPPSPEHPRVIIGAQTDPWMPVCTICSGTASDSPWTEPMSPLTSPLRNDVFAVLPRSDTEIMTEILTVHDEQSETVVRGLRRSGRRNGKN